ncbi:hypothetical protein QNN00_15910 [Bacillus velezensis]|nr:hypothetical protein [Bacillus velezensis]
MERLLKTNNFPEFTGRVCPLLVKDLVRWLFQIRLFQLKTSSGRSLTKVLRTDGFSREFQRNAQVKSLSSVQARQVWQALIS